MSALCGLRHRSPSKGCCAGASRALNRSSDQCLVLTGVEALTVRLRRRAAPRVTVSPAGANVEEVSLAVKDNIRFCCTADLLAANSAYEVASHTGHQTA